MNPTPARPVPSPVGVRTRTAVGIALVVLSVAPLLGGVGGDFVGDDVRVIRNNPEIRSPGGIPRLFAQTYWREEGRGGLYRPLVLTSFALDGWIWGRDEDGVPIARGIHLGNLILNAVATLLLFQLLLGRFGSEWAAGLGAALFAVHPVHVEPVVHLVGRADVLMAILFLGAYTLHQSRATGSRWLAAVLYLASLLTKEMAAGLPVLFLVDAALRGGKAGLRSETVRLWPYAAAFALYMLVRGLVLGSSLTPSQTWVLYVPGGYLAFQDPAPGEVFLTMIHAMGEYVRLLVLPWRLSADYSGFPHATGPTAAVLASGLLLVVLVILAVRARRRGNPEPLFWLSWFAITIFPVSNLAVMTGIIMAERVLYLPSVAFAALAGLGSAWLVRRRRVLVAAPLLVITLFSIRSAAQTSIWADEATFFEQTWRHGTYAGHLTLVGVVKNRLDAFEATGNPAYLDEALPLARESVRQSTNAINVHYLAKTLELRGHLEESVQWWDLLRQSAPADTVYRGHVLDLLIELADGAKEAGDVAAELAWIRQAARLAGETGELGRARTLGARLGSLETR